MAPAISTAAAYYPSFSDPFGRGSGQKPDNGGKVKLIADL
jgi:hypothetical protein